MSQDKADTTATTNQLKLSRRQAILTTATAIVTVSTADANPRDAVALYPNHKHSVYRVRMMIDVEGNVEVPKNELTVEDVRKLPVKAESVIDYEERLFRDSQRNARAARRYYYEAKTTGKLQTNELVTGIRNETRRAIAQMDGSRSILYGERTQMTEAEMQLLRVPVNSLAIDRLLPSRNIKPTEKWEISDDILACLFDMDAVQKSTVTATLVSADQQTAKMQLEGNLSASIDGVPTAIRLRGKMTFDRSARTVTWLALALREDREIGKAEPGFEIAAQIRVIRRAMPRAHAVKNIEPIDFHTQPGGDDLMVDVRCQAGGFSVFCNRNWRVMNAGQRFTMMRMIENDNVVAQCDIRAMPKLKEGHQLTLEAMQAEIQRSLGSRFEEFLEAEERVTGHGLRLIRVVAQGSVEKIPVQWIYLHFSNDAQRRTAAIFTIADKQLEKFGGDDVQFAQGFRFIDLPKPKTTGKEEVAAAVDSETGKAR